MDKKNIIIIVLFVLCLIFIYLVFKPSSEAVNDKFINSVQDSLQHKNQALQLKDIVILDNENKFEQKIDSIQSEKPKIKTVYVKIYSKIDNNSSHGVINQYDSLFSSSGVK